MWTESDDYDYPPPRMRYPHGIPYQPGPGPRRQFLNYPPHYDTDSDIWDDHDWDGHDWDSGDWDPSRFRAYTPPRGDQQAGDNPREEGPRTCFTFRVYVIIGFCSFLAAGIVTVIIVVKGMENPY